MPARKPVSLNKRHDPKADRKQRADSEAAFRSKDPLQLKPPALLAGHPFASALWRKMIGLYGSLDAEIISSLDEGMLTDYCILSEQVIELDFLRTSARTHYDRMKKDLIRIGKNKKLDPRVLIKLSDSLNWSLNSIVKLDGRVDRKRAFLHTLRQSLYMTPRSRAGVAPQEKEEEPEPSTTDKLIDGPWPVIPIPKSKPKPKKKTKK